MATNHKYENNLPGVLRGGLARHILTVGVDRRTDDVTTTWEPHSRAAGTVAAAAPAASFHSPRWHSELSSASCNDAPPRRRPGRAHLRTAMGGCSMARPVYCLCVQTAGWPSRRPWPPSATLPRRCNVTPPNHCCRATAANAAAPQQPQTPRRHEPRHTRHSQRQVRTRRRPERSNTASAAERRRRRLVTSKKPDMQKREKRLAASTRKKARGRRTKGGGLRASRRKNWQVPATPVVENGSLSLFSPSHLGAGHGCNVQATRLR